jgi:hypothetical protein
MCSIELNSIIYRRKIIPTSKFFSAFYNWIQDAIHVNQGQDYELGREDHHSRPAHCVRVTAHFRQAGRIRSVRGLFVSLLADHDLQLDHVPLISGRHGARGDTRDQHHISRRVHMHGAGVRSEGLLVRALLQHDLVPDGQHVQSEHFIVRRRDQEELSHVLQQVRFVELHGQYDESGEQNQPLVHSQHLDQLSIWK